MSLIVLPSIIALILKILILGVTKMNSGKYQLFSAVIIAMASLNVAEIILLLSHANEIAVFYIVKAYYVLTLISLSAVIAYTAEVAQQKNKLFKVAPIAISVVLSVLILFTPYVISGVELLSYASTAKAGGFYWMWQISSATMIISVFLIARSGYVKTKNHQIEIRCIYIGLSFLPLALASLSILFLMGLGYQINAVASLSIASTMFLLILLASEYQHRLTDVRRFIPGSSERRASGKIMKIFSDYSRDDIDYRQAVSEIERLLVMQKYDKSEGNASVTAGKMGMPRSSLYSIFNRLEIESRGDKKS